MGLIKNNTKPLFFHVCHFWQHRPCKWAFIKCTVIFFLLQYSIFRYSPLSDMLSSSKVYNFFYHWKIILFNAFFLYYFEFFDFCFLFVRKAIPQITIILLCASLIPFAIYFVYLIFFCRWRIEYSSWLWLLSFLTRMKKIRENQQKRVNA